MRKIKLHKEKDFEPITPEESKKYMDFNKVLGYKDLYQYQQIKKPIYKKPMFLGFVVVVAVVLLAIIWEDETSDDSKKIDNNKSDSTLLDSIPTKDTVITSVTSNHNTASIRPLNAHQSIENTSNTNIDAHQETPMVITDCSFPGGEYALEKFIKNEIRYPYNAIDRPLTEYVQVDLMIDSTGKALIKKIGKTNQAFTAEINDLIAQMPKWNPKKINQKPVYSEYTITVPFIYKTGYQY